LSTGSQNEPSIDLDQDDIEFEGEDFLNDLDDKTSEKTPLKKELGFWSKSASEFSCQEFSVENESPTNEELTGQEPIVQTLVNPPAEENSIKLTKTFTSTPGIEI